MRQLPDMTRVYVNRGRAHGVRRGMRGKLCGQHPFQVDEVHAARSRLRTRATRTQIGECRTAAIVR